MSNLAAQLAAAKAAYAASPTAEKKAAAMALVRAVAAEKKAAEPVLDLSALARQAKAAQEARAKTGAADVALERAKRMYEEAHEYPRCGEQWPFGHKEEEAMAILVKAAKGSY